MLNRFRQNILNSLQVPAGSRILAAVSGGMDSMAMLHLLNDAGFETGIAHANFGLRGHESDMDEGFVKETAARLGNEFYSKRFETGDFSASQGISIQMAARELRYEWFHQLAKDHRWDFIATAHHLDDQIETFFINLFRGTGISGLTGMPARSGIIIRPLLAFYRSDVEMYVRTNRINYREDSSNRETDYLRNRIRHKLLPLINELQPAFPKVMAGNIEHLAKVEEFYLTEINKLKPTAVRQKGNQTLISIPALEKSGFPQLLLHEILKDFGFNTNQTKQIFATLNAEPGKVFHAGKHRLIKDREALILEAIKPSQESQPEILIDEHTHEIASPIQLNMELIEKDCTFNPQADPNIACLDYHTLNFPLKLRKWQQGDRFRPFGMKGSVKLSDYFTANKFSLSDKEKAWLLTDAGGKIIWIIGHRIADDFRIKPETNQVFKIFYVE